MTISSLMRIMSLSIITLFISCQSTKSTSGFPDYSESISKPIELIKNQISKEEFKTINISIIDSHGYSYSLDTRIQKTSEKLTVLTNIINTDGTKSDTVLIFTTEDLLEKLKDAQNKPGLVLAGHYQDIAIKLEESEQNF